MNLSIVAPTKMNLTETTVCKFSCLTLAIVLFGLLNACKKSNNATREHINFNSGWHFSLSDSDQYSRAGFDDSNWRSLQLPHDWSIEGEFSPNHPAGVGGGALPGGTAWYRKSFKLRPADSAKRIYITFDGVYHHSDVFVNGAFLGHHANGYIGFQYDLTKHLHFGKQDNVIAVRVNNSDQPNSRWYSGSGIYRNVWLEKTAPIHIDYCGTYISTQSVSRESAMVTAAITIKNTLSTNEMLEVETQILDKNNRQLAKVISNCSAPPNDTISIVQHLRVVQPQLWSVENPTLYKTRTYVRSAGKTMDEYVTNFGIRYFEFDSNKGFSLNGKPTKILGVCNHHDLGALGAAIHSRAVERQLEILKSMGCNAIRTSHNPPAPELLDLCDRMGFIVMNETFDMWARKKVEHDYSTIWETDHEDVLVKHLLRDRNHPSVMMWSIGNEILEQWDSSGMRIAAELAETVKKFAPGIPVTSAMNHPQPDNYIYRSGALDLVGYNYKHETFEAFPQLFPGRKFIATETTSSLHTRGSYNMPADSIRIWPVQWDIPFHDGNPDQSCSAYDNCRAPWGSTHSDTWKRVKKHDFLSGMFIWTGFDYLGEPTPYQWPSRSSYFGIIDLAGFPKDIYYMYQSEWTNKPVLHLLPHWNWQQNQLIDVLAYTNFDEVELFLNDRSLGLHRKTDDDLHLAWKVRFEPGTLKAVGRKADGATATTSKITAGPAAKITLMADRNLISADGHDLAFITVRVEDQNGVLVPYADNLIHFEVDENLAIAGVDNGCQISHEPFKANYRKAFNGQCLLIVKAGERKGVAGIKAKSNGLETAFIQIEMK